MTPYFLDLFFFYKTRYWKYSLQTRPVLFVVSRLIKLFLFLLILTQIGLAFAISKADLDLFRQLSMRKLVLTALLLNVAGNLYFPAKYQQDIKKGRYYLFPLSAYTLNNMRIAETLSSILFLASFNLLILPVFSRSLIYGISLPVPALCLCILSLFIGDLIMAIFGKLWIFFLTLGLAGLLLAGARYISLAGSLEILPGSLETLAPATPATRVTALLALSAVIYFLDTRVLRSTSIKNVPHE